ncbi:MAG: TetR/AcrR family transcriptional regulator [Oscillospiraceae bacterium]|nr:TetR/AcrR family transcriptional regulator [Oscillospiraceae bacterium]
MAAPRKEDIKQSILENATRLLHLKAFSAISLGDIARAAGISKGTLYYYYNNKDDILFDIADAYLNRLASDLIAWTENKEKDTSLPRLLNYIITRGVYSEGGTLRLYLIAASASANDALRCRIIEKYQYFNDTLCQKLKERTENADCEYIAWLLLTVMDGLLVQTQLANEQFRHEAFVQSTVAFLSETLTQNRKGDAIS